MLFCYSGDIHSFNVFSFSILLLCFSRMVFHFFRIVLWFIGINYPYPLNPAIYKTLYKLSISLLFQNNILVFPNVILVFQKRIPVFQNRILIFLFSALVFKNMILHLRNSVLVYWNQGFIRGAKRCLNPYFFGWLEK